MSKHTKPKYLMYEISIAGDLIEKSEIPKLPKRVRKLTTLEGFEIWFKNYSWVYHVKIIRIGSDLESKWDEMFEAVTE